MLFILGVIASDAEENKNIKKNNNIGLENTGMHFSLANNESDRTEREKEKRSDRADAVDVQGSIPEFSLNEVNALFNKFPTSPKVGVDRSEKPAAFSLCNNRNMQCFPESQGNT